MKLENWNGHSIRFVEHNGEWWAVAQDVCAALGLTQITRAMSRLDAKGVTKSKALTDGGQQVVNIISEKNIYRLAFRSNKPEAVSFQNWVFDVLKSLRESAGLEGFEVFRMLDKQHQRDMMKQLSQGIGSVRPPVRVDFIKANIIVNKAVSTSHGYPKMVKKADMTPDMLLERESVLADTVSLMTLNERYHMGLSVSEKIYRGKKETG